MKRALRIGAVALSVLVVVLVAGVLVLASSLEKKLAAPDTPFPSPEVKASTEPAVVARGEYVVRTVGHCTQCHGDYPRANPAANTPTVALSGGFEFKMGPLGALYAANLTSDPETGIGRRTDQELARTISTGVLANGQLSVFMRYSAANLSREDVVAVVSYLRTLAPVKKAVPPNELSTLGKAAFATMTFTPDVSPLPAHVPPADEPSVERGGYLVEHVALCVACHSRVDMATFETIGPKAGGGDTDPSPGDDADMEFTPPNLTAHPTGITGKLDEQQFVDRFRAGRAFPSSKMPWENFSRMSESDLRSIYRYLRSLPPVDHDVGPTYRKQGWKRQG